MNSKKMLINDINGVIAEINLRNHAETTKGNLKNYLGEFNNEIDRLLLKFFDINNNISSFGGIPILKEIIGKITNQCIVRWVNSTACLMLVENEESNVYIDSEFINKFQFENFMTIDDLKYEARLLAARNNIENYTLDFSELKEVRI